MKAIPTLDPPLQSGNLVLRRWRSEDAPALFLAFTDPDVLAFSWAAERAYTQDDAASVIYDTHAAPRNWPVASSSWPSSTPRATASGDARRFMLSTRSGATPPWATGWLALRAGRGSPQER